MEENKGIFNKGTLIIILILIMFSSKIVDLGLEIGKGVVYLVITTYVISMLNQEIATKIKDFIINIIDMGPGFIKEKVKNNKILSESN